MRFDIEGHRTRSLMRKQAQPVKHSLVLPAFVIHVAGLSAMIDAAEPVDIGSRRELFVDDLIIGALDGTKLKMHEPHRLRRMPPRPFGHYATVLQENDRLRLYYRGDKIPGAHWRNGWGKYHESAKIS